MKSIIVAAALTAVPASAIAQATPQPAAPAPAVAATRPLEAQAPLAAVELSLADAVRQRDETIAVAQARAAGLQAGAQARAADTQARALAAQADAQARARIVQTDAQGKVQTLPGRIVFPLGSSDYDRGLSSLQQKQYDRAVESFDRVITAKAPRADGALYWKAYAQRRLGRFEDALATLAVLRRDFPQSRYLADGRVLEADVRKMNGQPVDQEAMEANDEIRLYALSGIANTDPDRAIPLLEAVLSGSNSLSLKKRAIYVLALSKDPRAHQVLLRYARGGGNPDLQTEAIRYLASRRDSSTTGAELKEIYQSTQDKDVRRAVIDAYRGGLAAFPFELNVNVDRTVSVVPFRTTMVPRTTTGTTTSGGAAARASDQTASATRTAAADELWALYQIETDADLRAQMTSAFASLGAVDRLSAIAKTDKDTTVRQRAIRSMGGQRAEMTGDALAEIYNTQQDKDVRKVVIATLANQNNADGLVTIARKETDLTLKMEIVRRLSELAPRNKVAADYLIEVIK